MRTGAGGGHDEWQPVVVTLRELREIIKQEVEIDDDQERPPGVVVA